MEKLETYDPRIFNIDFNDIEDLRKIGGGNFGAVWHGTYFGTNVAVKQLLDVDDEDMHKYITREMLTLRFGFPGIIFFSEFNNFLMIKIFIFIFFLKIY